MGTSLDNGVSPFQINYKFYDEDSVTFPNQTSAASASVVGSIRPYSSVAKPCDQELVEGSGTCSCTDCQRACSVPDFSTTTDHKWNQNCYMIWIGVRYARCTI